MLILVIASVGSLLSSTMFHRAMMVFDTRCQMFIVLLEFTIEMCAPSEFSLRCRVRSRPYGSDRASNVKAVDPMKVIAPLW